MGNPPVGKSEVRHYSVFMIGVFTMLVGVAIIVKYEDVALYLVVGGGVMAVLAMISQAYVWYKNGDL